MKHKILILVIVSSFFMGIFSFNTYKPIFKKEKLKINITTMGDVKKSDVSLVSKELINVAEIAKQNFLP